MRYQAFNCNRQRENTGATQFSSNPLSLVHFLPLSLAHPLPRWVLVTTVTIIGALLIKIFMDPAIAVCNLCRASSLSIIDKLTTIFVPTVSIFRKHQREAALELGGEFPLEQMIKDQDTRFDAVEKEVRRIFHTQVKLQATVRKMENRSEVPDVKALNAEIQNLSALISESKNGELIPRAEQ